MFNHSLIKRSLVVGLTAAVMAFPVAAQAQYAEDPGGASVAQLPVTGPATYASSAGYNLPASAVPSGTQSGSTFDWGDAGIGAGSVVLLLGASGLGAVALRRRRPQRTLAS